jgi:beta-glucanase (GH16 family)
MNRVTKRICKNPKWWRVCFVLPVLICGLASAEPPAGYKLAWSDEFDGTKLDTDKWQYWLPGRRHDAINTPEAIAVTNGCLVITTYAEGGTNYTAMVSTRERFEPVRGYWEARIEFNDVPGMWSAFWLQSPTMGRPPDDPVKAGMEIDIIEHRAAAKNGNRMDARVQHTLHWNGYGKAHQSKTQAVTDNGLRTGFHVYGFEWTESAYRFYVDGKLTWTVDGPISKSPEFVILSSEVKDRDWAGSIGAGGFGGRTRSTAKMLVDYVRYYRRESEK